MPAGRAAALICDTGALIDYLAESFGVRRLAARDVRHFAAVRLRHGGSFELVVYPSDFDDS